MPALLYRSKPKRFMVSLEVKEREIEFRATLLFQDTRVFTCRSQPFPVLI